MNKKMIFFDIDGTLIPENSDYQIPESTRTALEMAHKNGHLLFVNTGRTYVAVDPDVRALPFDGYVTGCGTFIYYHGRQLLAHPLSHEFCREIVTNLRNWNIPVFFEGNDDLYYDPQNPTPQWKYEILLNNFKKESFTPISMKKPFVFDKFLVFPQESSNVQAFRDFCHGQFTFIDRGEGMFEMIQSSFSKATGIQYLMDRFQIALNDCYVIGDSTNDLPMLTYVPNSIAMGNSMKEILPYCSYQTTDILDILPRKQKYEASIETFEGRNSYSKTDHDATFMRMKEDAMLNGQLKPGYNIQIGTENRYIVGFTIHPNPTDTKTMIPHLQHRKEKLGKLPKNIIADAGYGSEENYEYLEENNLGSYVKYNKFHWEKKRKNRENPYLPEHLPYDKETDSFLCRNGKHLVHVGNRKYVTEAGYETRRDYYRCEDCSECSYAEECKKTEKAKTLRFSHRLNELKKKANENLCSEIGLKLRSQRVVEVEQTFGRIKGCWSFRRFLLRGKEKVKIEWGLLCIAHNITKLALEG